MRVVVLVTLFLLSGCASDKLALAPSAGVDLSGHWRLNEADSDDPLHLIQSQNVDPSKATPTSQGQGGGRGGRQGGRGGPGGFGNGVVVLGPSMPTLGAMGDGMRWPGREVQIKQMAGVVVISSGGFNQVYQPTSGDKQLHHHPKPADDDLQGRDRDMPVRDREDAPAICGWKDKTLVVQGGEADDDHPPFEERYSLSEDGQRLIEVVGFNGGRSNGFTLSRVWDRVDPGAPPPGPGAPTPIR